MGYVRRMQKSLELSSVIPLEIIKLCHKFYLIIYRWDPSTKPNDNDDVEINEECDTISINKPNQSHYNIFGDAELEFNQIHKINFLIHEVNFIHLGICSVDGMDKYLNQTTSGFHADKYGSSYMTDFCANTTYTGKLFWTENRMRQRTVKPYKKDDKLCMIVDLINGKLDWELNGESINFNHDIKTDIKYKIAFMAWGKPNKVQLL